MTFREQLYGNMYRDSQLRNRSLTIRGPNLLNVSFSRTKHRIHDYFVSVPFFLFAAAIFTHTHTYNACIDEYRCTFLYTAGGKVKWTTIEAEVDGRKKGGQVGREMTVSVSRSCATRFISTSIGGFIHVHSRS